MQRKLIICLLAMLSPCQAPRLSAQILDAHTSATSDPLLAWRLSLAHETSVLPFSILSKTAVVTASEPATAASSISVFSFSSRLAPIEGFANHITPRQIETSAGTFGDPSRFLQTLAGVASNNDQRNDFIVRGGNPVENGFVIDNIEIPSINQFALSDTTGGFVSMLDAAAIHQLTLHTDAYDSRYDQRLSSVIDISTRSDAKVEPQSIVELGLAGLGGSSTRPLGRDGALFYSVRQSVLQYATNDIGLNGVPIFRNAFVRAEQRINTRNNWWGISLTGIDSMNIRPSATDTAETNAFDIDYSGWRNTTGINWQHLFSARSFAVLSLAQAEQSESVLEDDQLRNGATVYNEKSSDAFSTLKYDFTFEPNSIVSVTAGVRESLDRVDYTVAQPMGLANPYSYDPEPVDATAIARKFATASSASYVQALISLPHKASLVLGERMEQWSMGGHIGTTGKALISVPLFGKVFHAGYAEYQQMPSTLYLLSFNNLRTLGPIHSRQFTGGAVLADNRKAQVVLELYEKNYSNYPVALDYPQLSLANIADTFGQAFLVFPMVGQGTGLARGAELTAASHIGPHLDMTATATYARSWYAGLDTILRRSNYDIPLSANVTGVWRITHGSTFSWRYTASSGRPYTPDDLAASSSQNRDVYDLTQVNAMRSTSYRRLDFRFEQTHRMKTGLLTWHAGLQNATNHENFYMQAWEPRTGISTEQNQMPRFPDGGIKYIF